MYLLHYRGYGGSSGSHSQKALFADAVTLFDEVHTKHPNIDIIGRSLGSGIAVYVASRRPAARLVLVTPYDSFVELAQLQFPYIPVKWLLRDRFESWRFAPQVLRSRFLKAPTSFKIVARAGHNTISNHPEYMELLEGSP